MAEPLFDAVSAHGYWSTAGLTPWNALRHRLFAPQPSGLILLTECGRDRVRDGPGGTWLPREEGDAFGWSAQGLSGDAFLDELYAFDRELLRDAMVYATVFTTSPDDEWARKGFSVDGLADACDFARIGPHDLEGRSPQALAWAARAPIVKSVDQTAAIRRARPGAITVYRRRFTPAEQDDLLRRGDAAGVVGRILEGLDGFRHPTLHVELLNEVGKGQRDAYLALCRAAVPMLRAAGLKVAGPSWATGDYEQEDWAAFVSAPAPAPTPAPPDEEEPMAVLTGIDVSNHQGRIDYGLAAADGVGFVLAKASGDEGPSDAFLDPWFGRNWAEAAAAGLVRGAYHYARPSRVSPAASVTTLEQALKAAGGLRVGDLVALDLEDPGVPDGVSLRTWCAEWLALAERVFGVAPLKYSAHYYTSTHDLEHADLGRYPTWWASYQAVKPAPVTGWAPIRIWQNSASATVPGVAGACDTNIFEGTRADLLALGLPAGAAPTEPPAPPPFDLDAARDRLWAEGDALAAAGYPWFSQAIKAAVALSKNER